MTGPTAETHPGSEEFIARRMKEGGITVSWKVIVEITARGRRFVAEVDEPRGGAAKPLGEDELKEKFRNNAYYSALSTDRIEQGLDMLYHLEEIDDIAKLLATLAVSDS